MKPIGSLGLSRKIAHKFIIPLSKVFASRPLRDSLRYFEAFIAAIGGKGSGSGWDMEGEVTAAISCITNVKNPVLLDIGANNGHWSSLMVQYVSHIDRLILVEPQNSCLPSLAEIPFANKEILQIGVGEFEESLPLYTADLDLVSSLYHGQTGIFSDVHFRSELINIRPIDDLISDLNIERIDYMKMDIEGHEFAALKGAKKSLDVGIIRALSFEFGASNVASRTYFKDFWDFLTFRGYKIKRIIPGGTLLPIDEYYSDLEYFRGATNYVAVKVNS